MEATVASRPFRRSLLVVLVLLGLLISYFVMLSFVPLPPEPHISNTVACPNQPLLYDLYGQKPLVETIKNALYRTHYLTTHIDYQCKDVAVFGGVFYDHTEGSWPTSFYDHAEGSWSICMDFWRGKPDCEIYSFGINHDFSFDDQVHAKHGCTIYSFDPTMNVPSHNRGPRLEFLQEGLYGKKSDNHNFQGWKVDTLKGFMDRFKTKRIDYLKIDVEYSEWSALALALQDGSLNNVDQIGFEVHFWADGRDEPGWQPLQIINRWNELYEELYKAGFRMWYSHTNPGSSWEQFDGIGFPMACCYEVVYINMNRPVPAKQ